MTEKKEGRVRKTLVSQVHISIIIRNLEVHMVLVNLHYRDQLKILVVRLFYQHH